MRIKLLIRRKGESEWRNPTVSEYEGEQALQILIEQSPLLLPGSEHRETVVIREFPIPRSTGFLDLLVVDDSGEITLVECKLRANPEIRRHIVGQLLAYAAGLWGMRYEDFDAVVRDKIGSSLMDGMGARCEDQQSWDSLTFREAVANSLLTGRFRLVLAVDEITDELKQVIEFLNKQTIPEVKVLAIELGYVADQNVEVLVPTTYGEEMIEAKRPPPKWDESKLFEALNGSCNPAAVQAFRSLFEYSQTLKPYLYWGTGRYPSVTVWFRFGGGEAPVWSCYASQGSPSFSLNFGWLANRGISTEILTDFARRISAIPGVEERLQLLEAADFRKRPSLPIDEVFAGSESPRIIASAIDWLLSVGTPKP